MDSDDEDVRMFRMRCTIKGILNNLMFCLWHKAVYSRWLNPINLWKLIKLRYYLWRAIRARGYDQYKYHSKAAIICLEM